MGFIDLHVHSTASDGSFHPEELVALAAEKGLYAFALTDHDTVAGIPSALEAAQYYPVYVIPGVEVSSAYNDKEIHILGYNIDYTDPVLISRLQDMNDLRYKRNEQMCARLREHGMDITVEKLYDRFHSSVLTRANFAQYMLEHGMIKTREEAFEKYIGTLGPCYIPRFKLPADEVVRLIHRAGGVVSIAHPVLYRMSDREYQRLFAYMKKLGVECIEAIYSRNTFSDDVKFRELADKFDFKITGGSDFHGESKPDIDIGTGCGNLMIPQSLLANIYK